MEMLTMERWRERRRLLGHSCFGRYHCREHTKVNPCPHGWTVNGVNDGEHEEMLAALGFPFKRLRWLQGTEVRALVSARVQPTDGAESGRTS